MIYETLNSFYNELKTDVLFTIALQYPLIVMRRFVINVACG